VLGSTAVAGPIADDYRSGVLGTPWGASLESVVGVYPVGDHLFSTAPGQRSYWVKDDQPLFDIPRDELGILYSFDKENRLLGVSIAFSSERIDQLLGALTVRYGAWTRVAPEGVHKYYDWRPDADIQLQVDTTVAGSYGITWLAVKCAKCRNGSAPRM